MIIRNESERRRAEEQAEHLRSELDRIAGGQQDEVSESVISGLHMQISDIEDELAEYERLKEGLVSALEAESFDDIGNLLIKARIARGWSQADLAEALGMEPQQVQRYERNDWQKISLWRLQEVVEALGLDIAIHARFHEHEDQDIEPLRIMPNYRGLYPSTISGLGLGIGETLGDFGVGVGEALGNVSVNIGEALGGVSMDISEMLGTLPTAISDVVYGRTQAVLGAAHKMPQATPDVLQMMLEAGRSHVPETSTPGKLEYRPPKGTEKAPKLNAA